MDEPAPVDPLSLLLPTEAGLDFLLAKIAGQMTVPYQTTNFPELTFKTFSDLVKQIKNGMMLMYFNYGQQSKKDKSKKEPTLQDGLKKYISSVNLYCGNEFKIVLIKRTTVRTGQLIDLFFAEGKNTETSWLASLRVLRGQLMKGWFTLFTTRKGLSFNALDPFQFYFLQPRFIYPQQVTVSHGIFGMIDSIR